MVAVPEGIISYVYRLPQQLAVILSRLVLCCHLGSSLRTNLHYANWTGYVGLRPALAGPKIIGRSIDLSPKRDWVKARAVVCAGLRLDPGRLSSCRCRGTRFRWRHRGPP